MEWAGRIIAFLLGPPDFAPYVGQRVAVSGPCGGLRDTVGPVPIFMARTIKLVPVLNEGGAEPLEAKKPFGATLAW